MAFISIHLGFNVYEICCAIQISWNLFWNIDKLPLVSQILYCIQIVSITNEWFIPIPLFHVWGLSSDWLPKLNIFSEL